MSFAENLRARMGQDQNVPDDFIKGLLEFFPEDFFSKSVLECFNIIYRLREDRNFIAFLQKQREKDPILVFKFLKQCVDNNRGYIWVFENSRRLGPFLKDVVRLAEQQIDVTQAVMELGVDEKVIDSLLVEYRCPITQKTIADDACKVTIKNANGVIGYRYYTQSELVKWVKLKHNDPHTRGPLTLEDIKPAPEYRSSVVMALKNCGLTPVKLKQILTKFKWPADLINVAFPPVAAAAGSASAAAAAGAGAGATPARSGVVVSEPSTEFRKKLERLMVTLHAGKVSDAFVIGLWRFFPHFFETTGEARFDKLRDLILGQEGGMFESEQFKKDEFIDFLMGHYYSNEFLISCFAKEDRLTFALAQLNPRINALMNPQALNGLLEKMHSAKKANPITAERIKEIDKFIKQIQLQIKWDEKTRFFQLLRNLLPGISWGCAERFCLSLLSVLSSSFFRLSCDERRGKLVDLMSNENFTKIIQKFQNECSGDFLVKAVGGDQDSIELLDSDPVWHGAIEAYKQRELQKAQAKPAAVNVGAAAAAGAAAVVATFKPAIPANVPPAALAAATSDRKDYKAPAPG